MDIYKFKKLLKRYRNGAANETERALVEAWYDSYQPDNDSQVSDLIKNKIFTQVDQATHAHVLAYPASWKLYLKIAAILLAFFSVGLIAYLKLADNEKIVFLTLQTRAGEIKKITLPDSSVLWVNASTQVRYPQQFKNNLREIYLDNGEAFFEVKHDPHNPFLVHTSHLNVQVLGTSFNISAYKNFPNIKVIVATGKVGITKNGKTLAMLTPGNQIIFDKASGQSSVTNTDVAQTQNWKKGYTDLSQATFDELARVVKNQLGIQIKAGDHKVGAYKFTLRIRQNSPFEQTLQTINQIHNTHYRKEGDSIIIY